MARVPVATPSIRQAPAATPYQRSIATADDFGGMQARATAQGAQQIGAVGNQLGDVALKLQIEDNEREAKALDVEFSQKLRAITYGDDQTPGYYATRGETAVSGYKDTDAAIREARRLTLEGAKNPRVREMFGTASAARVEREMEGLSRHMAKERRVANDSVSEARLNEAADDAGRAWNNPKILSQSMSIVRGEVADMAARNGWAPEVTASKMQEAQTVLHRNVINSALVQDPGAAKAYFDKNKDKIDGRVHADIEKALETGTLRQQSQAEEDRIMSASLGEAASMAEARKIKDPKLRDETVQRIGLRFAEKTRIEARADRERKDSGWAHVLGGGSVDDLPPQTLAQFDGTTISSMRTFEKNRAKDGRGFSPAVDRETDKTIHELFMGDKVAFAEFDMNSVASKLTEERYNYWTSQQRTINKADEKSKEKAASYSLSNSIAKQFMDTARWDYGEKGKDSAKAARVYEAARGVVDTLHADGKRATSEDITKAMKELFLTGEADGSGWLWDKTGPRAAFLGTDNDGMFILTDIPKQKQQISEVTGVPVDLVEKVVQGVKDAKLPVTAANIKATYERATSGR